MDLMGEIARLYARLPQLDCKGCGTCCVSPSCTLAEFIYLIDHCRRNLSPEQFRASIAASPKVHPDHEGNTRCVFLHDHRCMVHPGRTGACRLFGVPSLGSLGIPNLVECENGTRVVEGDSSPEFVRGWLHDLTRLNSQLHAFGRESYFVRGFNVECWLDIYFDDTLDFDVFADIRAVMFQHIDLSAYKGDYVLRTNLREKIDKISILATMLGNVSADTIRPLLLSIRDDYPFTGTYFLDEIEAFLGTVEKNEDQ